MTMAITFISAFKPEVFSDVWVDFLFDDPTAQIRWKKDPQVNVWTSLSHQGAGVFTGTDTSVRAEIHPKSMKRKLGGVIYVKFTAETAGDIPSYFYYHTNTVRERFSKGNTIVQTPNPEGNGSIYPDMYSVDSNGIMTIRLGPNVGNYIRVYDNTIIDISYVLRENYLLEFSPSNTLYFKFPTKSNATIIKGSVYLIFIRPAFNISGSEAVTYQAKDDVTDGSLSWDNLYGDIDYESLSGMITVVGVFETPADKQIITKIKYDYYDNSARFNKEIFAEKNSESSFTLNLSPYFTDFNAEIYLVAKNVYNVFAVAEDAALILQKIKCSIVGTRTGDSWTVNLIEHGTKSISASTLSVASFSDEDGTITINYSVNGAAKIPTKVEMKQESAFVFDAASQKYVKTTIESPVYSYSQEAGVPYTIDYDSKAVVAFSARGETKSSGDVYGEIDFAIKKFPDKRQRKTVSHHFVVNSDGSIDGYTNASFDFETGIITLDTNKPDAFWDDNGDPVDGIGTAEAIKDINGNSVVPSVRYLYLERRDLGSSMLDDNDKKSLSVVLNEEWSGLGITTDSITIGSRTWMIRSDSGAMKETNPVSGTQTTLGTVNSNPSVPSDSDTPYGPLATITDISAIPQTEELSVSHIAPANKIEKIGASSPRLLFRTANAPLVPGSLSFTVSFAREYKKTTPTDVRFSLTMKANNSVIIAGQSAKIFKETWPFVANVGVNKITTTVATEMETTIDPQTKLSSTAPTKKAYITTAEIIIQDVAISKISDTLFSFSTNAIPDDVPLPIKTDVKKNPDGTYIKYGETTVFDAPVGTDETVSISVTAQSNGQLTGTATLDPAAYPYNLHVYGSVDYVTGVVDAIFGVWMTREDAAAYPWYSADMPEDADGKVFYAHPVVMGSVRYNAVAYSSVPVDAAMLGIDAARLPSDGRVPAFHDGQMVLVHHTGTHTETTLSASQAVDMGRARLYRVSIDDSTGKRLPAHFYSVNRASGIVTMASDLNMTGYSGPYTFRHTIADMARVIDADLSGKLSLNRPVTHAYPADDSRVSGAMYAGTLQARVSHVFAQTTWTSVWSNTRIGDSPLAQYNSVQYPIHISNRNAVPDRYMLQFTSSTVFRLVGEQQGIIDTGNINEDFSPINTMTGQPIMTIDYRGWGLGWSTGNVLRFNIASANVPIAVTRSILPSDPTDTDDSVELILLGNVDA